MASTRPATDGLIDAAILAARGLKLRAACAEDMRFERVLFESAWAAGALLAALPDAARTSLLDQQFRFQTVHYGRAYPDAARFIILAGNLAIGRIIVDASASSWSLIDIALVPSWRGKGVGTLLLQGMLNAAARAGAPSIVLTVEVNNPARRLYERLGFVLIEEAIPNAAMEWRPLRAT